VIYDDGRHFMATTEEKFDIITTDPLDPWMAGSAALYSIEYYELAKRRLNEGGFISQWMQLIEVDEATVKSLVGTFLEIFPEGTLWSNHIPVDGGNDLIMLGQVAPLRVDAVGITSRLEENPALGKSLAEVKIEGVLRLLAAYLGEKRTRRSIGIGAYACSIWPGCRSIGGNTRSSIERSFSTAAIPIVSSRRPSGWSAA
jgi:spermidine synthase